jgi:hypothetical protein
MRNPDGRAARPKVQRRFARNRSQKFNRKESITMTNLLSLKEARTAKADAIRAIVAQASAAGRDLTEQEQSAFDAGKSEVEKLEKEIRNAEFLADLERRMDGQKIMVGSGDSRLDVELRSFSLRKAILSQVPGHTEDCQRERELSSEIARRSGRQSQGVCIPYSVFEKRVMTSDVSTGGGAAASLVATDLLAGQSIDILRAALITSQLGATGFAEFGRQCRCSTIGNISDGRMGCRK